MAPNEEHLKAVAATAMGVAVAPPKDVPGFDVEPGKSTADPQQAWAVGDRRRKLGYWLGGCAVGLVSGLLIFAYCEIASFGERVDPALLKDPQFALKLLLIKLIGHGVVTIAAVYFCYQVLRAAERFALPHWMAESKPETVSLLLGVRSPLEGAAEFAGKMVKAATFGERK